MMEFAFYIKASRFLLMLCIFRMKYISSSAACAGLGQLVNGRTFFRYGGIYANFACNPGYSLLGHVSSSCIQGRWRKPAPVCVANGCHIPSGVVHGSIQVTHNNAVVTVMCKRGYRLIGSSLIYCDGKKWNSTIPICREMDMMDTSLLKKNSETEIMFVIGNALLKREPMGVHFNITEKRKDNVENSRKEKDSTNLLKAWERQRQLQSPKTFLIFEQEKKSSQQSIKASKAVKSISTPENHTKPPDITKAVTGWDSWPSAAYQMQTSKIIQKIKGTPQIKDFYNFTKLYHSTTPRSFDFTDYRRRQTYKNATNSSHIGSQRTTITITQATQHIQSKNLSTLSENETTLSSDNDPTSLSVVAFETISKTIPPPTKPYNKSQIITNTPNFSKDTYVETVANATTPAQMWTTITSSLMDHYHTSSVQVQTTPIAKLELSNVEADQESIKNGQKVTSTTLKYKEAQIHTETLSTISNVKTYSPSGPGATSTITAITSHPRRSHKNLVIHKTAFKRRVPCVYPPLPIHGTFRFLTVRDPLPNQYPYYIQYMCYPGYTMSAGDVLSFCKDDGEWSGLPPVCEG